MLTIRPVLSGMLYLFFMAALVSAQEITGTINGRVTDETDAALPGVSITLTSTAIIGERITLTDDQGAYTFTALPPGKYDLKYHLSGFKTLVRQGIDVRVAFTATVHVPLPVAALEETITVQGESPVVDISSSQVGINYTQEVLKSLPNARDIWVTLAQTPGIFVARHDVGGATAGTQTVYRNYGSFGQNWPNLDGVFTAERSAAMGFYFDYGAFTEIQIGAAANSAEMPTPGTQINTVIKTGSNELHGEFYVDYESEKFNGNNLTPEHRAQGIDRPNKIKLYNDWNVNLGGRLIRDKLWWFASFRDQRNYAGAPGFVSVKGENDLFPTRLDNETVKLTYQLTPKNAINWFAQVNRKHQPYRSALAQFPDRFTAPDAVSNQFIWFYAGKVQWTATLSPKLLLDATVGYWGYQWPMKPYSDRPRYRDFSNPFIQMGPPETTNINNPGIQRYRPRRWQYNGSLSWRKDRWAGGRHEFKFGAGLLFEEHKRTEFSGSGGDGQDVVHWFRGCAEAPTVECFARAMPVEVRLYEYPWYTHTGLHTRYLFVQDGWNLGRRWRLNLGLRLDSYDSFWGDQEQPAGRFQTRHVIPWRDHVVNWLSWAPRLGFIWDLFGDGKTALKMSYGRYYFNPSVDLVAEVNPAAQTYRRYEWTDRSGARVYRPGEEGRLIEFVGGQSRSVDKNLKHPFTDEFTAGLEREVIRDLSVRFNFVRKFEKDRWSTYPLHMPPEAFVPVPVADPGCDGRGAAAGRTITVFDIDSRDRLKPENVRYLIKTNPAYVNNFVAYEIEAVKRFSRRWQMISGFTLEKFNGWVQGLNDLYPTTPNGFINSGEHTWYRLFKLSGSYDGPWGIHFSTVFKHQQGDPFVRTLPVSLPNLGTVVVNAEGLGSPGLRLPSVNLWDIRVSKTFKVGDSHRLEGMFDLFNALNSDTTLLVVTGTGSRFGYARNILPPRVFRLGFRYSF